MDEQAVLATAVTALLVQKGGRIVFTNEEWEQAISHEGSLFFHRDEKNDSMLIVLMPRVKDIE